MPRPPRDAQGNVVYHVGNRGSRKGIVFRERDDYLNFEWLMAEAHARQPMRILAYCLMYNHWHLLLWPHEDEDLSRYMHWLETTHASLVRYLTRTQGQGAVYQSRYCAHPIVDELHFLSAWRYIERNPVEARIVERAEDWPWSSAATSREHVRPFELDAGPIQRPRNWLSLVNGEGLWDLEADWGLTPPTASHKHETTAVGSDPAPGVSRI